MNGEPHDRCRSDTESSDCERNNAVEEGFSNGGDDNAQDSSSSDDDASDSVSEATSESRNELEQLLYPGAKLSRAQSLMMVMAHSLRHHSSKEATDSLLRVLDAHMPQGVVLPKTKF